MSGGSEVSAVHKRRESKQWQRCEYKAVTKIDQEKLDKDRPHEKEIANSYGHFKDEFIEMGCVFKSMWDVHLRQINTAKHRIESSMAYGRPVHLALVWADSKA